MKQTTLISIAVLTVIVIAGFLLSPFNPFKKSLVNEQSTTVGLIKTENGSQEESFFGSIADLLQKGKNITCSYQGTDESGTLTKGTLYVASNKVRADFTLTQPDKTKVDGHFIRDGNYGYTWFSNQTKGTKIKLSAPASQTAEPDTKTAEPEKSQDLTDDKFEYKCRPWLVDNTKFTPTADIEFEDLSQKLEQMQDMTKDVSEQKCAICNQVPADKKTLCLESLGC